MKLAWQVKCLTQNVSLLTQHFEHNLILGVQYIDVFNTLLHLILMASCLGWIGRFLGWDGSGVALKVI